MKATRESCARLLLLAMLVHCWAVTPATAQSGGVYEINTNGTNQTRLTSE